MSNFRLPILTVLNMYNVHVNNQLNPSGILVKNPGFCQLPMVGFEHMRTIFNSTQSQESKTKVGLRNRTQQCALGPFPFPSPLL